MSAVCGLRFTDFEQVALFLQATILIHINCSSKATKQSRDLSVCLLSIINNTSRSWLNDNATFMKVLNKILMLKKRQCVYCSVITSKSIPVLSFAELSLTVSSILKHTYHLTGADLDRFIRFAQTCQIFSQKNFS